MPLQGTNKRTAAYRKEYGRRPDVKERVKQKLFRAVTPSFLLRTTKGLTLLLANSDKLELLCKNCHVEEHVKTGWRRVTEAGVRLVF